MKGRLMEFEHLRNEIIEANTISNQMYSQMDVKRGLEMLMVVGYWQGD